MNKDKYKALLARYKDWCKKNSKQQQLDIQERKQYCIDMQSLSEDKISNFSEEDFYNLMAPLWSMGMWGNKHYKIDQIIENNGMTLIRKELKELLHGKETIEKRWDNFRDRIKGIGPAAMSEILNKFAPNEYILWNSKAQAGFNLLEIENVPKSSSLIDGKKYKYLCQKGQELVKLANGMGVDEVNDLLTLDYFIWQEMQDVNPDTLIEDLVVPKTSKESTFVHNDVRDRIRDIGELLGFKSGTEKKIADGAVVDAIWEVSVSNMGRITYVFEVQTKGNIDSLLLNLLKSKNNSSVQGVVAVSDAIQIEKIKKEAAAVKGLEDLKFWDYNEVLKVYENLSNAFESINSLGLVPNGLF